MAEQGSDANIMPTAVFDLFKHADSSLKITALSPAHNYSFLDKEKTTGLKCHKRIIVVVHLRIRHGAKLILRGIEWNVSEEPAEFVIIGREVLQAIGCDNKAMLLAFCAKHDGVINVAQALQANAEKRDRGTVASLLSDGDDVYYSQDGAEEDDLLDSGVYIDIEEDAENDLDAALNLAIENSGNQGLSEKGGKKLRQAIWKHKSIFD